jgi:transcriptional regulator
MAGPKPVLGYPSRTAAVLAMRAEGKETHVIAKALGIPVKAVSALEHSAARYHRDQSASADRIQTVISLPWPVLVKLQPHADRRAITANHLARLLVLAVIRDDLVDAVMDDADRVAAVEREISA